MKKLIGLFIIVVFASSLSLAKEKGKVQQVDFDGASVKGAVRNPDGAYLIQKRGVEFIPLYKVKENFSNSIKESIEYLR